MDTQLEPKGCLAALFDLSFSEFVTTKLIRWLYILLLVLILLGGAAGMITGLVTMFTDSFVTGLGIMIGTVLALLIYTVLARVAMESILVIFRIAENTAEIARQGRRQ